MGYFTIRRITEAHGKFSCIDFGRYLDFEDARKTLKEISDEVGAPILESIQGPKIHYGDIIYGIMEHKNE